MATVPDNARPDDEEVNRATSVFTPDTSAMNYNRAFIINESIPDEPVVEGEPLSEGANEIIDDTDFFLPSTDRTVRIGSPLDYVTPPIILGQHLVGAVLTAASGSWMGTPPITLTYTWFMDGAVVGTGSTYTPAQTGVVYLQETATNPDTTREARSALIYINELLTLVAENVDPIGKVVQLHISGAVGPYTVDWDDGTTTSVASSGVVSHTYASANTFSITVTSNDDQSESVDVVIADVTPPSTLAISTLYVVDAVTRLVEIVFSGGVAPYTIDWGDGSTDDVTSLTTFRHTYATVGAKTVTVTDSAAGNVNRSVTLTTPFTVVAAQDGTLERRVNLTITGGTSPYSINWGDGYAAQTGVAGPTVSRTYQVPGGTRTITVTDAAAVVRTVTFDVAAIVVPEGFQAGMLIGEATPGSTTDDRGFSAIAAVRYGGLSPVNVHPSAPVTVIRALTNNTSIRVQFNNQQIPDVTSFDLFIDGITATPVPMGWDAANSRYNGTRSGLYAAMLTHVNEVRGVSGLPVAPALSAVPSAAALVGTLTITGGVRPFTIEWGDGSVQTGITTRTPTHTYAAPGVYPTVVTDAVGQETANALGTAGPIAIQLTPTDLVVGLTIAGSTTPFSINWGDGNVQTGVATRSVLHTYATAGTRTVTVTGNDGQSLGQQVTTNEPLALALGISGPTVTATISGGVSPFSIDWGDGNISPPAVTRVLSHTYNVSGTYTVRAIDASDRAAAVTTAVTVPPPPFNLTATVDEATMTATLTIVGGVGPFNITWGPLDRTESTASRSVSYRYRSSGSRTITATDAEAENDTVDVSITSLANSPISYAQGLYVEEETRGSATGVVGYRRATGIVPTGDVEVPQATDGTSLRRVQFFNTDTVRMIYGDPSVRMLSAEPISLTLDGFATPIPMVWSNADQRYNTTAPVTGLYAFARSRIQQNIGINGLPGIALLPGVWYAPPTAQVAECIAAGYLDYNVFSWWEYNHGGPGMGQAFSNHNVVMTALAGINGDTSTYTGGRVPMERALAQLKRWANGYGIAGRGGYPAQFEIAEVADVLLARYTPELWNALSTVEQNALTIQMEAAAIGSLFDTAKNMPYRLNGTAPRTVLGVMLSVNAWNFSGPPTLIPILVDHFMNHGGGTNGLKTFMDAFNHTAWIAKFVSQGLTLRCKDAYDVHRQQWTAANLPAGTAVKGDGGPTGAQVQAVMNAYISNRYNNDCSTASLKTVFRLELLRAFPHVIAPGMIAWDDPVLNPDDEQYGVWEGKPPDSRRDAYVGRIANPAHWAAVPYLGLIGDQQEFDIEDGGGPRASLSYVRKGHSATLVSVVALGRTGFIARDDDTLRPALLAMDRGIESMHYKSGGIDPAVVFESYSKSGRPENSNETHSWTADAVKYLLLSRHGMWRDVFWRWYMG